MIAVRSAEPFDGHALGDIHTAAWGAAYGTLFEPEFAAREVESRRGRWHQRIADGTGAILLAELDGRPLALSFTLPSSTRPGLAETYSFYGHPDGWGSGVAVALMTETLSTLHGSGYGEVHLWTLRRTAQSRRFYIKCGFTESGDDRTYDFGDGQLLDQIEYRRSLEQRRAPSQAQPRTPLVE